MKKKLKRKDESEERKSSAVKVKEDETEESLEDELYTGNQLNK